MGYERNGRVPKVKDRWYGDHKYRNRRELKPREFKGKPQFTFDELYITPFTHRRYSEDGRVTYVPMERNLQPTDVRVMDDFLRSLSAGHTDVTAFCERYGARTSDIDSLIFRLQVCEALTSARLTNCAWPMNCCAILRLVLLTSPVVAVSVPVPILYFAYQRDLKTTPSDRREKIRQQGDEDRFRIE